MSFSDWINNELEKRGWSQRELARRSKDSNYTISSGQLSHIINGSRQAGPEACIAIAHALGVSREEVFRARGWLLREALEVFEPNIDPRAEKLAKELSQMPFESREITLDAIESVVNSAQKLTNIQHA